MKPVILKYSCNQVGISLHVKTEGDERWILLYIVKWKLGVSFDAFVDSDVERIKTKVTVLEVIRERD